MMVLAFIAKGLRPSFPFSYGFGLGLRGTAEISSRAKKNKIVSNFKSPKISAKYVPVLGIYPGSGQQERGAFLWLPLIWGKPILDLRLYAGLRAKETGDKLKQNDTPETIFF